METKKDICDWNEDIKWSELCMPYCIELLNRYSKKEFKRTKLEQDKKGSDLSNGKANIDVKANRPIYDDTNIVIEWEKGWLLKEDSICTHVLWVSNNSIILLDFKKLKEYCIGKRERLQRACKSYWKTTKRDGYEWSVECTTVPMWIVNECIIRKWEFNWGMVNKKESEE